MIPVFSAQQVRQWDSVTMSSQRLTTYELMERAASSLSEEILMRFGLSGSPVLIACGPGNNGGDGLAMTRLLSLAGYRVEVLLVGDRTSADRRANLHRLTDHPEVIIHTWPERPDSIDPYFLVIDALLGTGFHGTLEGIMAEVVEFLNGLSGEHLAVDMPTGLSADHSLQGRTFFHADLTLTIQCPKPSLIMAENQPAFGEWVVVDIALDEHFRSTEPPFAMIQERRDILPCLHAPQRFAHKGQRGHALLVCGSMGMMGAAILAGEACLRAGAGKLTMHAPAQGSPIIHAALPEAMVEEDKDQARWTSPVHAGNYNAVGIGPGIGRTGETAVAFERTLVGLDTPAVLDADALFALAARPDLWSTLPPGTILTPHLGEFRRLLGPALDGFDEISRLRQFCLEYRCIVVLKGAFSRICLPDGTLWINPTGNPGMATAGSGDVLTGMITGLLAQGYAPGDAARAAVYLHGLAGDLALDHVGAPESLIARDIVAHIGEALLHVRQGSDDQERV